MHPARKLLAATTVALCLAGCSKKQAPAPQPPTRDQSQTVRHRPSKGPETFNALRSTALAFRVKPGSPRIIGNTDVHGLVADWTTTPGTTVTIVCMAEG